MEDCKVNYDYTVRNASGSIVQFLYGEDGMDPVKIESQSFPYIEDYDYAKLCRDYLWTDRDDTEYLLTDELYKKMKDSNNEVYARLKKHFDQLVEDRHFLITKIFNYKQDTNIFYPVSFLRIITIARSMFSPVDKGVLSDLDPTYVLDTIETLCQELFVSKANKGNKFMNILLRCFLSPKKVAFEYKFNRLSFDWVVQQVKSRFYDSIVHASESVGVIAAQSIGEPTTQLTLNSVDWETELLLNINGINRRVKIGEFIDNELDNNKNIEQHPNDTKLGWIKEKNIKVLSCDENGKISWKLVEAVTQHPPVNEDGSNTLLKVKTHSGREIIATKAKSFLTRVDNKIVHTRGDEIKVGDYLPVSMSLPICGSEITHWDVSWYLPKTTYVYMSEVNKALDVYKNKKNKFWFKKNQGNTFTIPYTRSDGFIDAFIGIGGGEPRRMQKVKTLDGNVYPKNVGGGHQTAHIPEKIPLDKMFGFFIGAYLSEGCCTTHHVLISNIDDKFNEKISTFCQRYSIKYHIDERIDERGHSKTMRLHCLVLADLISKTCGRVSYEKRIPAEFFSAPQLFIEGLVDGYFSGDGTCSKKQSYISATSVSKGLIIDVQALLTKYGIDSRMVENHTALEHALKKGYNASLSYTLNITACGVQKFRNLFSFTLEDKEDRLRARETTIEYSRLDVVPKVKTVSFGEINLKRSEIQTYLDKCTNADDIQILKNIQGENIVYDQIVSIEEIPSSHKYVYDLTVQDTRNFNAYNALCLADTFHSSGISSASKAVRGVPRIKELLSVTKNIKTPNMTIAIKPEFSQDKKKCTDIMNSIQTIFFKDIVKSTKIFYDPNDYDTTVEDDKLFMASYKEFVNQGLMEASKLSPWLLRMEFDREKMYDYNITMMDINYILNDFYDGNVKAMFSDDNANKLICRIKLEEDDNEERDFITELKALEKSILENLVVKGIKKVHKAVLTKKEHPRYNEETMQFDKHSEWLIDTSGTNLLEILGHSKVDATRTISNDINEIYEIFGIEAARQALYNELSEVLVELYVNYRHIALLVDTMTNKGYLLSIDRHGINRVDIGPLAKCSFEETTDMLIKAGMFSEIDKINGVSANIMLGQIPPCGTGDTQILIDETKLMESILEEEEHAMQEEMGMSHITDEMKDNVCSFDNLSFDFKLPTVSGVGKKVDVDLKIV